MSYENYLQMMEDKIASKVNQNEQKRTGAIAKIKREGNLLNDYIVNIGKDEMLFNSNGVVKARLNRLNKEFNVHSHAVSQLGERFDIPSKYLRDLSVGEAWEKQLCAKILNTHLTNSNRQRVLVREVSDEIRAVLSESYKRFNTPLIFATMLKSIEVKGGILFDAYSNDIKNYVEAVYPKPIEIDTVNNGIVAFLFGMRFSTSDFGAGAVDLRTFIMQGICLNGAVTEKLLHQVHLGKRIESDNFNISQQTYDADSRALAMYVRDISLDVFDKNNIDKHINRIRKASEVKIDMELEIKKLPKMGVLKNEIDELFSVITNNNKEDGVQGLNTVFKLSQSIGAIARNKDDDRKRELEELSGKILLTADTDYKEVA